MAADTSPVLKFQQPSVPVELDVNDLSVPLTKERALGLQAELFRRFSSNSFQTELDDLRKTHSDNSTEFRKARLHLASIAQEEVLPKYGYRATPEGVAEMRSAIRAFEGDPEVRSNTEVIDHLLGDGAAAWMVAHGPEVSHLEQLSRDLSPELGDTSSAEVEGVQRSRMLGISADSWRKLEERAHEQERHELPLVGSFVGAGIGVELDINDIKVPLTRERALSLQEELLEAFGRDDFQERLRQLQVRHSPTPGGATLTGEFRKARQMLALEVQAKILPKYGFQPTLEGVNEMLRQYQESFPDDHQVQSNIGAVDRLLLVSGGPAANALRGGGTSGEVAAHEDALAKGPRGRSLQVVPPSGHGFWVVVGGHRKGGLLVRLGEDMTSHAWPEPLETGAIVKEVQRINERLHYEKISGKGPNYGWVSIHVKDHELLKPYTGDACAP